MGGQVCEGCGRAPGRHLGLQWINRNVPFKFGGSDKQDLRVRRSDYGPGRRLNVTLLTHAMGPDLLTYLQQKGDADAGAERSTEGTE